MAFVKECAEEFVTPFLAKIVLNQRICSWEYFKPKAAILQMFNLLNCMFFKLKDVINQRRIEED